MVVKQKVFNYNNEYYEYKRLAKKQREKGDIKEAEYLEDRAKDSLEGKEIRKKYKSRVRVFKL